VYALMRIIEVNALLYFAVGYRDLLSRPRLPFDAEGGFKTGKDRPMLLQDTVFIKIDDGLRDALYPLFINPNSFGRTNNARSDSIRTTMIKWTKKRQSIAGIFDGLLVPKS
jgi:hypothetical protein